MKFVISAVTDTGITKDKNEDSYHVRIYDTSHGQVVFAVLCDGAGGLAKAEMASATVVKAFCKWADEKIPLLHGRRVPFEIIHKEWMHIVSECNEKIRAFGRKQGIKLGTTATALLFVENIYYIIHVGDTRIYEITDEVRILTKDQTFVAREVERGILTPEQAEKDYRRCLLLQCVGASEEICPEVLTGTIEKDAVYLLCSDGFRHEITGEEICHYLNADVIGGVLQEEGYSRGSTNYGENYCKESEDVFGEEEGINYNMELRLRKLVEMNKQRNETDNITVIGIRTS